MAKFISSHMRPQVTRAQLEEAANKLDDVAWNLTKQRTQTRYILESLRPQIEKARAQGASWQQIAEQVTNATNYRVTKNMLSLHFTKKGVNSKAEKILEEDGAALAQAPKTTHQPAL